MTDDIAAAKQAMRKAMAARRDAVDVQQRHGAAESLAALLPARIPFEARAAIGGYFPFRSEFDVQPLLRVLAQVGRIVALPAIDAPGRPLLFRRYAEGDAMQANRFAIPEPGPQAAAIVPTHVLVPLLAFDVRGYRLGYGGGYYDRTLAALRGNGRAITAIGIGYDFQNVPLVPHEAGDERLDLIVTERGLYGPQAAKFL